MSFFSHALFLYAVIGILSAVLGFLLFLWIRRLTRIKYRFITVGSHKLRTPLSKIGVAVSELVEKKEAADLRKEPYVVTDYDERMMRQIAIEQRRMVGLVNLLLEVSESESGHATHEKQTFDLVRLVQEILTGYQNSQWRNDRAFIDFQSTEQSLLVQADKRKISSVIQVLLENAITYSPSGGKIAVLLLKQDDTAVMSIKDPGIGILKNERGGIFNKFYRSDRAFRIDTEGTGVGLFLARHIVEGHKGKMWFDSRGDQKGSTFSFSLPIHRT